MRTFSLLIEQAFGRSNKSKYRRKEASPGLLEVPEVLAAVRVMLRIRFTVLCSVWSDL